MISLIQIFWGLTGFFGVDNLRFMECKNGGEQWIMPNIFGDLFPTLHVAAVIMHAVMVILIFYRFPRRHLFQKYDTYFITQETI